MEMQFSLVSSTILDEVQLPEKILFFYPAIILSLRRV